MSIEVWNTIAAFGTLLVIGATAVAAVVQLRHLRANTALEGLLVVLDRLESVEFDKLLTATRRELPKMVADKDYMESVRARDFDRSVAWLQLANRYERAGSLVKYRLIPEEPFLDVNSTRTISVWELMRPMIDFVRSARGPTPWENFEYLYVRAKKWEERHKAGNYPAGTPRADAT